MSGSDMQVALKQMDNFSWFGYPADMYPSVRDFLPGLDKVARQSSKVALYKFALPTRI